MNPPKAGAEAPIFGKLYDLIAWLTHAVEKFPRSQRFLLAQQLLDTAYACHADLIRARKVTGTARAAALLEADIRLETLRLQIRLAHDLRCFNMDQYAYAAQRADEVGRMLGAWRREP